MAGITVALVLLASACALPHLPRLQHGDVEIPPLPETSILYDAGGRVITTLHAVEDRTVIAIRDVPQVMRNAVIAIEDQRFYDHHGVDVKALIRAAYQNARSGRIVQGGSTITEQLVKNTITGKEKTLSRKIREALIAYELEDRYTKNEILEKYLNTVYFGQGAYGIQAAAKSYFSVPASQLTLRQAALLAGLVASPARYDPIFHPEAARERRADVLDSMRSLDMIEEEPYRKALHSKLGLDPATEDGRYPAAYFVDYVKRWFLNNPQFGDTKAQRYERLFSGGLRIHTTIDLTLQRYAEQAVNSVLLYPSDPYGAMTVLDPRTGAIRAMVGGRDFFDQKNPFAQVNLATGDGGTGRQAGSAFKPFALVAALEAGISPTQLYAAPPSIDIPQPPGSVPPVWHVENYDGTGSGYMTLEQATIDSVNTVYAQVIQQIGPDRVISAAHRMGIQSELRPYPSTVLGVNEVTPLEMASGYGTLATVGRYTPPVAVTRITDSSGNLIYKAEPSLAQAVDPAVAWTADQILQKVIQGGTGIAANIGRPAGGKTGTAQQWRDAWFVGFIPQLVGAVWVGFPQGQVSMVAPRTRLPRVLGGTWPAQIWHAFMVNATRNMKVLDFPRPDISYVTVSVDTTRGCLPNKWTLPKDVQEVRFLSGTQPTAVCTEPNGPQSIVVPSVVGLPQAEAEELLSGFGLVSRVAVKASSSAQPGTVISQDPSAGSELQQGSAVTITVAKAAPEPPPPTRAKVPAVVGMTSDQAANTLEEAGFEANVIVQWQCDPPDSCQAKPNEVWKQAPSAGTTLDQGSVVRIWTNPSGGD